MRWAYQSCGDVDSGSKVRKGDANILKAGIGKSEFPAADTDMTFQ